MGVLSPDGKFLLVGTTFDVPIAISGKYPDGSLILWVPGPDGETRSIASNAPDPDGIVVFPVGADGTLREGSVLRRQEALLPSTSPSCTTGRIPSSSDMPSVMGSAVGQIDADGKISIGPLVQINTSSGVPSELCWLAVSPDDRFVFATDFGYSYMSSFRIDGSELSIAKDPASRRSPEMAPSERSMGASAAARATVGFRQTGLISTRSTGMRRSWWGTPPSQMAR